MSEHDRAAQEAKTSFLFRLMADRMPGFVWATDADLRLTASLGAGLAATHSSTDQAAGKKLADVFPDDDEAAAAVAAHRRALRGESVDYDQPWSGRTFRVHVEQLVDHAGGVIGCVAFAHDTSEQRQTEEQLRKSEHRYRLLAEAIPQLVWRCDADGEVLECNHRWYEYTGQTPEEAAGHGWMQALHPDDKARVVQRVRTHVAEGEIYQVDYQLRRAADGSYRWHLAQNLPMRDKDGKITGWFGSATDVDDRKRVEEELRASEERYRKLAESTTDIVYILDKDGALLYANPSAAACMGTSASSLVGKGQHDLFPAEMAQRHTERIGQIFATGQPAEADELFHFGSEEIWLNVRSIPLRDERGQITSVMGVCRNITDRKRAEEALQKAHDELEQRVQQRTAELTKTNEDLAIFRRFAEASGEGFGMSDFDGRITYVNPTLCRLFGEKTPEAVIGKSVLTYYTDEYKQRRKKELIPALLREGGWHVEQTVLPRHGKPIQTLQSTFLIRDENGNPFRIAVVISDITERKQAEKALQQAHDQLQTIYDGMIEGLVITDVETKRFVRVNSSLCRMLGYFEEELLAMSLKDIHPPEEVANDLQRFQAVAEGRVTLHEERPVLRKDGSIFYADIVGHRILYDGRPCTLALHRDVTERKQAEEALQRERRTLEHMLRASDHERQLIAYDIHDGLAQQLAGAIMQFQIYDHLKDKKPQDAAKAYDAGTTMLRQGHFEARRLISGVRPPILDESGVLAAIAHLVHDRTFAQGPEIRFHSNVTFNRLASILENAIYRIVQEGLTNARNHSKSQKVRIRLLQRGHWVRIEIRDWGIGFDAKKLREQRFGLAGIRERARLLGGKSRIQSKPGKGTRLTVELPVVLQEGSGETAAAEESQ